jgi:hypothetical protein
MKQITENEKKCLYGSGLPGMMIYGSIMLGAISNISLNKKVNSLLNQNSQLQQELNSKDQALSIDVPFFYQK